MAIVMTDIVGSVGIKQRLGDHGAAPLLQGHNDLVRGMLERFDQAEEIETAGDSFLLIFAKPSDAVVFSLQLQAALRGRAASLPEPVQDRIGIHVGEVMITDERGPDAAKKLFGIQVDTCARVMSLGGADQILLSRFAFDSARQVLIGRHFEGVGHIKWVKHGFYQLKGVQNPLEICEVGESGAAVLRAPNSTDKAHRIGFASRWFRGNETMPQSGETDRLSRRVALVGTTLIGLLLLVTPLGRQLTNWSYDLPFLARPPTTIHEAALVYMDDDSHKRLGQPWFGSWDRTLHARLIDRLGSAGAKVVAFDILFDQALTNSPTTVAGDQQFLRSVKEFGKVVVGGKIEPHLLDGEVIGMKPTPPFPELRQVASWGLAQTIEPDQSVRKHFAGAMEYPSLAWRVAELAMNTPPASEARWINFYGPPGTVPYYSYHEVLSGAIPASAFSNKTVFVGARYSIGFTGGKGSDDYLTPYSEWTGTKSPGVEINATIYLNLVRGDWLRRLSPIIECLIVLVFGAVLGGGFLALRPLWAVTLTVLLVVLIASAATLLVWWLHYWFPWLVVAAAQVPFAFGWSLVAHTRHLSRKQAGLELELEKVRSHKESPSVPYSAAGVWQIGNETGRSVSGSGAAKIEPSTMTVHDHELVRRIGSGAYGEVWLAKTLVGVFRAVKIVHRKRFSSEVPFEREFRGLEKFMPLSLRHPGWVHVLQVGRNDTMGYFYYIMELGDDELTGQEINPDVYVPRNLGSDLARRRRLPVAECVEMALRLTDALEYLHQHQLIHRDIKPSNIIFQNGAPKFADIGLITEVGTSGNEVSYLGTEGYIAPEGPGTAAADVFSLGKVLYEASMGRDRKQFPELPTSLLERQDHESLLKLNRIILKACETDVNARYQSAAEMQRDLESLLVTFPKRHD